MFQPRGSLYQSGAHTSKHGPARTECLRATTDDCLDGPTAAHVYMLDKGFCEAIMSCIRLVKYFIGIYL